MSFVSLASVQPLQVKPATMRKTNKFLAALVGTIMARVDGVEDVYYANPGVLTMHKSQLTWDLVNRFGMTKKDAKLCVETVFSTMSDALAGGGRIEIRGFAMFKVKQYRAYQGRNPKSGQGIAVDEKKLPVFRMGRELKKRLNDKV
jgi:integration host factor subunit beta